VPPSLPPQRPVAPPPATRTADQQAAYAAAEALRARGAYAQALQAFTDFIQQYPPNPLTDDALLAAGQLASLLGDYRRAQLLYQSLLTNFSASEHLPAAHLGLGVALYNLRDYERSLAALRQALAATLAPQHQGTAHYYLGAIARAQQRYAEAIAELKQSVDTGTDAELVEQARRDIATIVRDYLRRAALERLVEQYPATYPGDILLSQLALYYREAGMSDEEMAVWQRFITQFPTHPDVQVAQARLAELQPPPPAADATKLGVLLPLSGDGGLYGQRALQGIELALAVFQERHPTVHLSLVIRDSQGDSAVGGAALRELVHDEHVIGVIGPLFSQEAIDIAPLSEQLGVPLLSPYAPDGEFPSLSAYAFRNSLTDTLQGRFLAEYVVRVLGLQRLAILHTEDPYGVGLKDAFLEQVRQFQGEVVAVASYPPEATDFSQPVKRLGGVDDETLQDLRAGAASDAAGGSDPQATSSRPYDAIFIPDYYDKVGLIVPALALYNLSGMQLLGADGWNAAELAAIGERFVEGAVFVDGFFAASPAPVVQEFVEKFRARHGKVPDLLAAQAYDALLLFAEVLKAGAASRQQLRDGLLQVHDFPGVSGTTSFGPQGDADKILYLLTIQNGRIVQLN
jgi:ABC-type branched-subunit amino acid transport system substrate-binding protein